VVELDTINEKPTKPIQQTRKKKKGRLKGGGVMFVFVNKKRKGFFLPTNQHKDY
jgi:hypothetical protein